jgi:hypothetical protein
MTTVPDTPQFPVPESPHTDLQFRDIYRRLAMLEGSGGGVGPPGPPGPPGVPGPGGSPADGVLRGWTALLELSDDYGEAPQGSHHARTLGSVAVTEGKMWTHLEMGIVIWGIASSAAWSSSRDVQITVIGTRRFQHWRDPITHIPGHRLNYDTTPDYQPSGRSYWRIYEFKLREVPTIQDMGSMAKTIIIPKRPRLYTDTDYMDPTSDFAFIPMIPIGSDVIRIMASFPENALIGVNVFLWGRFLESDPVAFPFGHDFGPGPNP